MRRKSWDKKRLILLVGRACQTWQAIIRCWLSISTDEAGVELGKCIDRDAEQTADVERLSLLLDDALRPQLTAISSGLITCDYSSLIASPTLLKHPIRLHAFS